MSVSIRNIAAITAMTLMGGAAFAGGCNSCGSGSFNGGITNIPNITPVAGGCCGVVNSQIVAVPGVYVPSSNLNVSVGGANIGGSNVYVGGTSYNISSSTYAGSAGGAVGGYYVGGGGGGYSNVVGTATSGMIDGLNVGGGQEMEAYMESRTTTEIVPIRAVCMDDKGMPHPASRPNADEQVAPTFDGEVFRCMAGTHMEVTIGRMVNGQAVWDGGSALSCQKGQAITYKGGQLVCAAQIAQRNCNERSLLRRFGPGIKYITLTRTTQVQAQRQQSSQYTSFRSSMFIDGGVGQGVY